MRAERVSTVRHFNGWRWSHRRPGRPPGITSTVTMPNQESTFTTWMHWRLPRGRLLDGRIDDDRNVNGGWDLSKPWTRFTQFTILTQNPPLTYTNSSNYQTWSFVAWKLVQHVEGSPEKGKAWMVYWKPKVDNSRKLGIHSVDPDDMEFKNTMQNARKVGVW